eukprot:12343-Heterococcus_DN1.PRE.3
MGSLSTAQSLHMVLTQCTHTYCMHCVHRATHHRLAKLRDCYGVGPVSQKYGVPVPFLTNEHLQYRLDGTKRRPADRLRLSLRVQDFKKMYDQLAWNVFALASRDPGTPWYGRLDFALSDQRAHNGGGPCDAAQDPELLNAQMHVIEGGGY